MQCPKCEVEMDEVRKLDVIIDSCSRCGGIWLDKGELEKIRKAESAPGPEEEYHEKREHSHDHGDKHEDKHGKGRKKKKGGFMDIFEGLGGE